jgi:hypothetical protein
MAATSNAVDTAGSNIVTGAGSSSVQFKLPGSPQYIIQSVVATVDNTAGGDTTATLTYADTNGEVIAKRPQGAVIPAGDTGTATFALRLTDDSAQGAAAFPVGFYDLVPSGGNPVPAGTQVTFAALTFGAPNAGVDLLDTSVNGSPSAWCVKKSSKYVFMARVSVDPHPSVPFPAGQTMRLDLTPTSADPDPAGFWATQATTLYPLSNVLGVANNTISVTRYVPVFRGPADPYRWHLEIAWDYVGDVDVTGFLEVIKIG